MSWSIAELVNTVKVSKQCATELFKAQLYEGSEEGEYWSRLDEVTYKGRLQFNPDHSEHMDYLWKDEFQDILKKHKAKGDVCFGSLEGDNAGSFWGYRFDGKGGMRTLEGRLSWDEKK